MNSFKKTAVNKILDLVAKKRKQKVVLGLATGSTPLPIYEELIKKHKEEGIDFSNVVVFHLDEYVGLPKEDPHSYRFYLKNNFLKETNIKEKNWHFLNGEAENLQEEADRYEKLIKKEGGIDLQILGIGRNGHIGFNEPTLKINYDFLENPKMEKLKSYNKFILNVPVSHYEKVIEEILELKEKARENIEEELPDKPGREDLASKLKEQKSTFFIAKEEVEDELNLPLKVEIKKFEDAFNSLTHVEELTLSTLKDNSKSYENIKNLKTKAITLGIGTILDSKKVILLAKGSRKAKIVKKALEDPVSIECPASLLRNHSNASFILDDAAASLLPLEKEKSKKWKIKSFLTKKYLSFFNKKRYLTIDLGGTYCRASLRDKKGKLLFSPIKLKTLISENEEVLLNQIIKVASPLLKIGNPEKTKILLATAGVVDKEKGIIKKSRNLKINNLNIKKRLKERLSFPVNEIEITNDIVAAWHGENKLTETSNFVSFYISTGIGGAFKNENLEPGWSVALSLDSEDEVKAARFLERKKDGFYNKEDLRKSEYFLEKLAAGPALVSFSKKNASSFPKSKLAELIKKDKVKNIPQELSKKAKKGSSFARYCLKRTGKYAGIGIGTVYNHFYKNNDKISLNKNTKFFINGSTGLNSFYFEGIKTGVKKANELFEHELPLKNIVHSKFKDSTEGVQKGLIFYYQNLIKNSKKSLPEDDSNIILSDEVLSPSLKTWPIVKGKEVIVLEKKKGEAEIFGGNLIHRLKKDNVVKKISIDKWKRKTFKPDLILAPENLNITTDRPILFYRTFPSSKEELKFNSYFGFNSLKYLLEPIKAYQEELKRVRYDLKSKFNAQYYGELLKYFSISKSKFAYIFDIRKVEKGKIEKIKGIASIKKIINSSQGKNIFISPHADDMEISAGALVRWMIEKGEDIENWIITESHNEKERREREAIKAKEILSTKNKKLKLDFMGFNKKNLLKEEVKEKIKYQIKDINNLKIVFLPSLKDSHPTHQKVRKIIEEMFLEVFDEFLIVYYSSPWIGEYNTYFLSDKNHEKGKESKIGSLLKKSIGKSGIVGELCGDFKEKGFFKNYAEQFKRN